MTYHYILRNTIGNGEIWQADNEGDRTIRIWPIYDQSNGETRYKCQDGLLHVWYMTSPEHGLAMVNGFDHSA